MTNERKLRNKAGIFCPSDFKVSSLQHPRLLYHPYPFHVLHGAAEEVMFLLQIRSQMVYTMSNWKQGDSVCHSLVMVKDQLLVYDTKLRVNSLIHTYIF
jgi:hypothetical protein